MNLERIKRILFRLIGVKLTAYIHSLRFYYLIKLRVSKPDPEVKLLDYLLNPGDVTVDVGANNSLWTYYLSQCVKSQGTVFAFEADPYYAKVTENTNKLLRLNNTIFFPFGLSNVDEALPLRVFNSDGERLSGISSIDQDADYSDPSIEIVQLKILDCLVESFPQLLETKLIKCDVEGYEMFVFQGAEKILNEARPYIILEVGNYQQHGYSEEEIYDFFKDLGYEAFAVVNEEGSLAKTNDDLHCDINGKQPISVNRLLIHKEDINVIRKYIL